MTARLRVALALCAAFGTAMPATALADPTAEASEEFHRGLELYRRGEFEAARVAFEEANRILPNVRVTANIAACLARLGRNAEALRTYRHYLLEGGEEIEPDARSAARRETTRLRPLVADLRVEVDPAMAEVLVDGVWIGRAPLRSAIAVEPGQRSLEVRARGHLPFTRVVQAEAGQEVNVSVVLQVRLDTRVRGGAQDGTPVVPTPPARPRSGRGPLPWITLSAAGALAIAATTTGLLALSGQTEYEDPSTSVARRQELYGPTNGLALATDVLLVTAGVAAAVTIVLFLTGSSER